MHRIVKNLITCLPLLLSAIHGNLGVTNQVFRIGVRACAECDSDACRSHHLLRVYQKRNPHSLLNTLRYSDGIARVSNILQQPVNSSPPSLAKLSSSDEVPVSRIRRGRETVSAPRSEAVNRRPI